MNNGLLQKKIFFSFLCIILSCFALVNSVFASTIKPVKQITTETNLKKSGDIGILSTSVWAEYIAIEYGNKVEVHYSFFEPHRVEITVSRDDGWVQRYYQYTGETHDNIFEFTPPDEGKYTFRVQPTDESSEFGGQVSVTVYKNTVIVIPGIMASELYIDNNKIWMPKQNVWGDVNKLKMTSDGDSVNTVKVKQPIPEFYETLSKSLTSYYRVVDYGYDRRLGVDKNAQDLKNIVLKALQESPYSEVFIVAHSMGGLVAAQYIKQGNLVDKLITIGTPYLGAPKAVYTFETGQVSNKLYQNVAIANNILGIIPNPAYQLLPTKDYFTYNKTNYLSYEEYLGPSWTFNSRSQCGFHKNGQF